MNISEYRALYIFLFCLYVVYFFSFFFFFFIWAFRIASTTRCLATCWNFLFISGLVIGSPLGSFNVYNVIITFFCCFWQVRAVFWFNPHLLHTFRYFLHSRSSHVGSFYFVRTLCIFFLLERTCLYVFFCTLRGSRTKDPPKSNETALPAKKATFDPSTAPFKNYQLLSSAAPVRRITPTKQLSLEIEYLGDNVGVRCDARPSSMEQLATVRPKARGAVEKSRLPGRETRLSRWAIFPRSTAIR